MQRCMGVNGQYVQPLNLPAICMHLWVLWQWCIYASMVLQVALLASLASATAGVALLAPLPSHRMATQCMSIIEVIKTKRLSAWGRK